MKRNLAPTTRLAAATLVLAVMALLAACSEKDIANNPNVPVSPIVIPTEDQLAVRVTGDIPTAVLSTFDDNSMGAAIVRRLSNTSGNLNPETEMILIKGEDILGRPLTEWLESAKIYMRGGYIAIEKPHDAHLVELMEKLSAHFEQASHDILTEDTRNGISITITPPANQQAPANEVNAEAARFKTRIANIKAKAGSSDDSENKPVAELVIFSRKGYYECAPYEETTVTAKTEEDGTGQTTTKTLKRKYSKYTSGLMADGAAQWLNTKSAEKASQSKSRADGSGAINELMSASEEQTYQGKLIALSWNSDDAHRFKEKAYLQTVRVWGVHNMDTNKDYYYVQQKGVASVGGKQEGDARFDPNKTLYVGPYDEEEYLDAHFEYYNEDKDHTYIYRHFYGSYYSIGNFYLELQGNGDIKLEDAIPTTDNNNTSTSIAVGETHSTTNTIGFSIGGIFSSNGPSLSLGGNYSYGWTDGTTYTMTTTTNVNEIKVSKNTEGNKVNWEYENTLNMFDASDEDEHGMQPDATTTDVNIDNQACWSVSNPEGAYTLNSYCRNGLDNYYRDDDGNEFTWGWGWEWKSIHVLIIPNRAVQKWYMDVTFPELGQEGFIGVKDELTDAIMTQFPDVYKPTMELADQTDTAENTIKYVVEASKQLMQDSNALQTLKEYALDRGISQFTIKWYTTDGKHGTFDMTVKAK